MCLAWIGVFIAIPIYSGAYIWHIHLALLGYAMLVGVALAETLREDWPRWRHREDSGGVAVIAIVLVFGVFGAWNQHTLITSGYYAASYRVSRGILEHPPIDPRFVADGSLFYIDNPEGYGPWVYGNDKLMALVYGRPDIQQREVPGMAEAHMNDRADWLHANSAFFIRLEQDGRWRDRTDEFRRDTASCIGGMIGELFRAGRAKEVASVMDKVAEIAPPPRLPVPLSLRTRATGGRAAPAGYRGVSEGARPGSQGVVCLLQSRGAL